MKKANWNNRGNYTINTSSNNRNKPTFFNTIKSNGLASFFDKRNRPTNKRLRKLWYKMLAEHKKLQRKKRRIRRNLKAMLRAKRRKRQDQKMLKKQKRNIKIDRVRSWKRLLMLLSKDFSIFFVYLRHINGLRTQHNFFFDFLFFFRNISPFISFNEHMFTFFFFLYNNIMSSAFSLKSFFKIDNTFLFSNQYILSDILYSKKSFLFIFFFISLINRKATQNIESLFINSLYKFYRSRYMFYKKYSYRYWFAKSRDKLNSYKTKLRSVEIVLYLLGSILSMFFDTNNIKNKLQTIKNKLHNHYFRHHNVSNLSDMKKKGSVFSWINKKKNTLVNIKYKNKKIVTPKRKKSNRLFGDRNKFYFLDKCVLPFTMLACKNKWSIIKKQKKREKKYILRDKFKKKQSYKTWVWKKKSFVSRINNKKYIQMHLGLAKYERPSNPKFLVVSRNHNQKKWYDV